MELHIFVCKELFDTLFIQCAAVVDRKRHGAVNITECALNIMGPALLT